MDLCGVCEALALVGGFRVGSRTSGCQRTLDNQMGETNKGVDFCSEPGMSWQVDFVVMFWGIRNREQMMRVDLMVGTRVERFWGMG